MNRRRFLVALAEIPLLRCLVPKPKAPPLMTASQYLKRHYSPILVVPAGASITTAWIRFHETGDPPRIYAISSADPTWRRA